MTSTWVRIYSLVCCVSRKSTWMQAKVPPFSTHCQPPSHPDCRTVKASARPSPAQPPDLTRDARAELQSVPPLAYAPGAPPPW